MLLLSTAGLAAADPVGVGVTEDAHGEVVGFSATGRGSCESEVCVAASGTERADARCREGLTSYCAALSTHHAHAECRVYCVALAPGFGSNTRAECVGPNQCVAASTRSASATFLAVGVSDAEATGWGIAIGGGRAEGGNVGVALGDVEETDIAVSAWYGDARGHRASFSTIGNAECHGWDLPCIALAPRGHATCGAHDRVLVGCVAVGGGKILTWDDGGSTSCSTEACVAVGIYEDASCSGQACTAVAVIGRASCEGSCFTAISPATLREWAVGQLS